MASGFHCGILPYIQVQAPIRVGRAEIWPNNTTEWLARTGRDFTRHTEMYRDRKSEPVGSRASVITPAQQGGDLDRIESDLRDHIIAMSTAHWLYQSFGRSADPWIVDFWMLPLDDPEPGYYVRRSKFSTSFTHSKYDLVHPLPHTDTERFVVPQNDPALSYITGELAKLRQDSRLRTFGYFFRSRFQLPFFSVPGEDVETLWSGFESMLPARATTPPLPAPGMTPPPPPAALAGVPGAAQPDPRPRKSDYLFAYLSGALAVLPHTLRPKTLERLEAWCHAFYDARNKYTHGIGVSAADLWMEDFGFNVYEIGLRVAEAMFNIELNVGNASKLEGAVRHLEATFLWKTAIDELLTRLMRSDRKHWYPFPKASEQEFTALLASLRDLAGFVSAAHGRVPDIRRGHASQKMGLVLSQWVKDLTGATPEGIDLAPVAWLPDSIDRLAGEGKTPAEIDKNLATELRYHGADDPEKYHAKAPYAGALLLGNVIPIWEWVGGFIDLNEVD